MSDSSDSEGKGDSPRPKRNSRSESSNSDQGKVEETTEFRKGPRTPGSPQSAKSAASSISRSRSVSRSRSRSKSPPDSPLSNSQQDQRKGPRSPPENLDDDGRSNISSGSSLLSDKRNMSDNEDKTKGPATPPKNHFQVPHAEDLSDVSDLDASDCLNDPDPEPEEVKEKAPELPKDKETEKDDNKKKKGGYDLDDGEQLDFEAEDPQDLEKDDGELEEKETKADESKDTKENDNKDVEKEPGEKEEDQESLEEGEVSDDEPKPEKPPICRFYSRGACTWGSNCRFLHPGVTDKGNYSMFETTRPLVASSNGLGGIYPHERPYPPPLMLPPSRLYPATARRDEAVVESAWERGLRQAKELVRNSTKRKETDMDFEEKKMNLTIGQDEIDKENDYYSRASPTDEPEWDRMSPKADVERRPRVVDRYEDIIAGGASPHAYDRYERGGHRGYEKTRDHPEYFMRREKKYYEEEESVGRTKSKRDREKMVREVIVQRVEKDRINTKSGGGYERKADEWSDPWMRSKSPTAPSGSTRTSKIRKRHHSYSSGSSSYSSSSRSSSNSSYSSYSRSRSRSASAGSRSRSGTPPSPSNSRHIRPSSPTSRKQRVSHTLNIPKEAKFKNTSSKDKKTAVGNILMNPPAPSPRKSTKEHRISPNAIRRVGLNPPPPNTAKGKPPSKSKMTNKLGKTAKHKVRSSSRSGSSGSSSGSSRSHSRSRSRSSYSSSSGSSRSPPRRVSRGHKTAPTAPTVPITASSASSTTRPPVSQTTNIAAKPSVVTPKPTPEVKKTIAVPTVVPSSSPAIVTGKKRPADDPIGAEPQTNNVPKGVVAKKASASRREELLKQLKAVEDAIARKRSKI